MRVLVLGSGVVGTSVAYYLARDGHDVEVVDRQPGPAMETSSANAGEVSPGYSSPWAGPGVPLKAIQWMLMHPSPLVIKPMLDLARSCSRVIGLHFQNAYQGRFKFFGLTDSPVRGTVFNPSTNPYAAMLNATSKPI